MVMMYLVTSGFGLMLNPREMTYACRIPLLEKNDQTYSDSLDKANILNDHFSSVFTIDNSPIDHTGITSELG